MYTKGAAVEGNYGGEGQWYPGRISRVSEAVGAAAPGGRSLPVLYDLLYDDGDTETAVPAERIRPLPAPASAAAAEAGPSSDTGNGTSASPSHSTAASRPVSKI